MKRSERVALSKQKLAFSKFYGKGLRWAQKQAAAQSKLWVDWCARSGGGVGAEGGGSGGVDTEVPKVERVEGSGGSGDALSEAAKNKADAADEVRELKRLFVAAVEPADKVMLNKSLTNAREGYRKAEEYESKLKQAMGLTISTIAFSQLAAGPIAKLGILAEQERDFIAGRLRPEERERFLAAWEEYKEEWNAQVEEICVECEAIKEANYV